MKNLILILFLLPIYMIGQDILVHEHRIDSTISFNGTDEYIETTSTIKSTGSISCWFNLDNVGEGQVFGGARDVSNERAYLGVISNNIAGGIGSETWTTIKGTTTLVIDTWYHALITWDGTTVNLFLNGVNEYSRVQSGTNGGDQPVYVGAFNSIGNPTEFVDGELKEFSLWDRVLDVNDAIALYNSGVPAKATEAVWYPIAYYPLGNYTDFPTVYDKSGKGNDGTMTNMVVGDIVTSGFETESYIVTHDDSIVTYAYASPSPSHSNKYADFNGTTGYVLLDSDVDLGTTYTLSAWVYRKDNTAADRFMLGYNHADSANGWYHRGLEQRIMNNNASYKGGFHASFALNDWTHLVAVVDGADVDWYFNNTLRATTTTLPEEPLIINQIGLRRVSVNYFWGYLDGIALYDTDVSASIISALYDSGNVDNVSPSTTNLVGYWNFDDNSTTGTIVDEHGTNDGTVNGTVTITEH